MANISLTPYTNSFFGSFLKSHTQMGKLSNNSATNISRLGTFKFRVGIGLSYRPASLYCICSLATQFQTGFQESIPRPIAGLKFPTQKLFELFQQTSKG